MSIKKMITTKNKKESKVFSNTLKQLIEHHGISFHKLSRCVGIARPHLMGMAKGKYPDPKLSTVDKIAAFFKVSHAQLVGEQKIDFKSRPTTNFEFDEE
jgi:transcriptional regulator with XRE-family HTH domain